MKKASFILMAAVGFFVFVAAALVEPLAAYR